ncbi:MAG: WD40/YVTN/BNR-like repeat-containing protein [Terriglobales bacterium]
MATAAAPAGAQQVAPALYQSLSWRLIGPLRGGKATTVTGAPGDPSTYYFGTAGSGVWKTINGGQTWTCVTDSMRLAGIASVMLAPSNQQIVYVAPGGGRGAGSGGGLLRSTDGGQSWDQVIPGAAIASVLVDAKNPDRVLAAGSTGVLQTTDGGQTWKLTLANAGRGEILAADPDNPQAVYVGVAAPVAGRGRGAGGFGSARVGAGGVAPAMTAAEAAAHPHEVYVTHDGGASWAAASEAGLPGGNHGTLGLAVAPGTGGQRAYIYLAQGIWRTDNGGASWTKATVDPRLMGGGQFHSIYVDPGNANVLYATQTSFYRSLDGGSTWNSWVGAPSGADYNNLWIDPLNDKDMIIGADQGTEITMDGGSSFTTWFNQPTGQMYNVVTDHRFPFTMYAAQQDSGTVAVPIRANDGEITYRDWYTTNGFETAKIQPDPADPNIIYSTGWYDSILRMDRRTGQTQHIFEVRGSGEYRTAGSPPMAFSPFDDDTLYVGTQYLMRTSDSGRTWKKGSPDLSLAIGTAAPAAAPAPSRGGRSAPAGAITSIAFSPLAKGEVWVGTSNGMIQLSCDNGASWKTIPAPVATPGSITLVASHAQPGRAYVLIGARRGGFGRGAAPARPSLPEVYRTDNFGQSWTPANQGLAPGAANALVEDNANPNLLFLSTPATVYASFDGGAQWQSIELNLPNGSNRDLALEQSTLVVATYGRALWAIDDIGPLRTLASPHAAGIAKSDAYLFPPTPAIRLQWDTYTDTPINPDVAMSKNPPDGAIIDYYLMGAPTGDMRLAIYDSRGKLVRAFSDKGPTQLPYKVNVPSYWLAPPALLPTRAGENRFVWNLRYPDPSYLLYTYFGIHSAYFEYTLADHAIPGNTPWHEPEGPLVTPGRYQVRLTVNGKTYSQPLEISEDPRLKSLLPGDLDRQLALSLAVTRAMDETFTAYHQVDAAQQALAADQPKLTGPLAATAATLARALDAMTAGTNCTPGASFGTTNCELTRYLIAVDQSDAGPTQEVAHVFDPMCAQVNADLKSWTALQPQLRSFNQQLRQQNISPLPLPPALIPALACRR